MKVVAFNGSPRKDGNTQYMIEEVFEHLRGNDVECERIDIAQDALRGCTACNACKSTGFCVLQDDLNLWFEKAMNADAIIIGSPVYFANVSAETKALIDRMGRLGRVNHRFKRKPFAALVAQRRAGALPTFDSINHMAQANEMLIVGSSYWNLGFGLDKQEVETDVEGIKNLQNLAENILWTMQKLK